MLTQAQVPTLLIVGERDEPVIGMNEEARHPMVHAPVQLEIVPGATHLFEEPGTLERVSGLAREWLVRYLVLAAARPASA